MKTKELKLINDILIHDFLDDKMDKSIDDFIKNYDNNTWCRGYFKTMIGMLIIRAKKTKANESKRKGDA